MNPPFHLAILALIFVAACGGDTDTADTGTPSPSATGDTGQTAPPATFDLSFSGVGYTSHVAETVQFALWDNADAGAAAQTWSEVVDANAELVTAQSAVVTEGHTYTLYWYADHDLNGACDAPPVDHGWTMGVPAVTADVSLVFDHVATFDYAVCDGF